ncbi:TetR/AcrR family transcriptional regulator [Lagierella sp. ICN-221743]
MPKKTFYNLSDEKRGKIIDVLKKNFEQKTIFEANVKEIVEELQIARGSFYQYFEDLEDSYFFILDMETIDVHKLFLKLLKENNFDVLKALEEYGQMVSEIIFSKEAYNLYKNKYLYWNSEFEEKWKNYKAKDVNKNEISNINELNTEKMKFIKALVHDLIKRNFKEGWSKEDFLSHYNIYMKWIKEGI